MLDATGLVLARPPGGLGLILCTRELHAIPTCYVREGIYGGFVHLWKTLNPFDGNFSPKILQNNSLWYDGKISSAYFSICDIIRIGIYNLHI